MTIDNPVIQTTEKVCRIANICRLTGTSKAVLCPGSRCAPLLIAFGMHSEIEVISVVDERSAGFIALGLAEQLQQPVALICTSGTAAQNFAPAVTEAYYQQVPLIIITADRPACWIDQWDGQTIWQNNMFEPHIKHSFTYEDSTENQLQQTLQQAVTGAFGPVHINLPIDEPFYPLKQSELEKYQSELIKKITKPDKKETFNNKTAVAQFFKNEILLNLKKILNHSRKILIVAGQHLPDSNLLNDLKKTGLPVAGDVISNVHLLDQLIFATDLVFKGDGLTHLKPDFLITIGRSVISKNLKLFLRRFKPGEHWHIGEGLVGDPFQSLTRTVPIPCSDFFQNWLQHDLQSDSHEYLQILLHRQKKMIHIFEETIKEHDFCAFTVVDLFLKYTNTDVLHLGNSMPVRMANLSSVYGKSCDVYCNRGTSGIDGTLSTAVGHALAAPMKKHTLLTGDIAFFYDRNALWLNHRFPDNLRIILINDFGGGIFKCIEGPAAQGDLISLITTPHHRTAKLTAQEFDLPYHPATGRKEFTKQIAEFKSGILEIFTSADDSQSFLKRLNDKVAENL